jgi:hypothetical protein
MPPGICGGEFSSYDYWALPDRRLLIQADIVDRHDKRIQDARRTETVKRANAPMLSKFLAATTMSSGMSLSA